MVAPSVYKPSDPEPVTLWCIFCNAVSTLQFKATALVVVLTLSVTAAVAGYLLKSSEEHVRRNDATELVNSARLLAKAVAVTMTKGDLASLQPLAEEAANGVPLLYVIISDTSGRQLAVAQHDGVAILQKLQEDDTASVPFPGTPVVVADDSATPMYLDVMYPVTQREHSGGMDRGRPTALLGYVRTGVVAGDWGRAMAGTLDLVVGVGVLALLAAVPLGFLVIRRIVAPLDGLADVIGQFSQGKLDVRSRLSRRDEIGRLAQSFNRMADQHQQTHERIIRLNAELEERVAHRTRQLRELASREPLTGLYNRRHFNEVLEGRFAEAVRYNTDLTVIMIDLDEFKAANDNFGHQVGDDLLVLMARVLVGEVRSHDVASRFGGDEFVILLPQCDSAQGVAFGSRIIERFRNESVKLLPELRVSMSVGVASLHGSEVTEADELMRQADRALYTAKETGKNRVCVAGDVADAAHT